ncbi:MAG: hypothetical protein R6U21_03075 [Thermoplasmatota archaeon]
MNKKTFISIGVLALFLSSGLVVAGVNSISQHQIEGSDSATTPINEEPLWLRLRNQIRDMLGIGPGDSDEECDQELVELSGILSSDDTYYFIDGVKVSLGPLWYISTTTSSEDYDNDGTNELISEELNGLIDTMVTLEGVYQSDQWFSAFTINTLFYRDLGRPIWSNGHGRN